MGRKIVNVLANGTRVELDSEVVAAEMMRAATVLGRLDRMLRSAGLSLESQAVEEARARIVALAEGVDGNAVTKELSRLATEAERTMRG